MKIDKYIAYSGFSSRRKAYDLIGEKRIQVNGKIATHSTKFNVTDVILIDGILLKVTPFIPTIILYNKPKGIICTAEKINGNIIDAINHPQKIYPVGRLDKDSEGIILLTNQGELIDKIANAANGHEKEYIVTLNLPVRQKFLKEISEGVNIMGEKTKPCSASLELNTKRIFRITLTQGLNRQIRRMCNLYNYQVLKLQRIRVMNLTIDKLKPGQWRNLTDKESKELLAQLN